MKIHMNIHMYMYIHMKIHMNIHMYIYIHMHIHMYIYIHMNIHMYARLHLLRSLPKAKSGIGRNKPLTNSQVPRCMYDVSIDIYG
jgi:hypothetical protein